ncbi:hypothetical protein TRAPUB_1217 [Trametes pubescens]|uniref:C-factor n=1 Tax=Trametes pubescens TaxID=154538 RepID=A0A1M2VJV5_TRAPU|nr:hypothetical protein TRAPUB_1217 [Trametes pubescens]
MSSATTAARQTTWLITGASRGIGLELVRQLLASPSNTVIAACRTPSTASALAALKDTAKGTLHVVQLDMADFESIRVLPGVLARILGGQGLDYLINNAGILKGDTPLTLDADVLLETLRTNTVGPALLTAACAPLLDAGARKTVLNVSSGLGSIAGADKVPGTGPRAVASYSMSKAALNMFTYKLKMEKPEWVAITLAPGWVKTDLGGADAALEVADSVKGILKVVMEATVADSGKYLRWDGEVLPW